MGLYLSHEIDVLFFDKTNFFFTSQDIMIQAGFQQSRKDVLKISPRGKTERDKIIAIQYYFFFSQFRHVQ